MPQYRAIVTATWLFSDIDADDPEAAQDIVQESWWWRDADTVDFELEEQ